MAAYVNSAGTWTLLPITPGSAVVNQAGAWTNAKEIWVAEPDPFMIGVFGWSRAWFAATPPAGVSVGLVQSMFIGGDVEASWTNAIGHEDYDIEVQFEINSTIWGSVFRPRTSSDAILPEIELTSGDDVRGRMRYYLGSVLGTWGAWSSVLNYT